ncbi:MAG: phosphoribosylanthranilate isomerase [Gammaproteobacteria bacterium]
MGQDSATTRVRIKICGITRLEDALAATRLGADAIGLVFFSDSPRAVSIDAARRITGILPPFVAKVGLFVNATSAAIEKVLQAVALDLLQFHGDEEPEECGRYSKPYIKAVRMHDGIDVGREEQRYAGASALLLDAYVADQHGGTGKTFDWSRIPAHAGKPVILAGGLTPANVANAIRQTLPYAVDVSGGVESGKGIKDARKMAEFIREVRYAESQIGCSGDQ